MKFWPKITWLLMSNWDLLREAAVPDAAPLLVGLRDFPQPESIPAVYLGDIALDGCGNPEYVLRGFDVNALRLPSVKLLLEKSVTKHTLSRHR